MECCFQGNAIKTRWLPACSPLNHFPWGNPVPHHKDIQVVSGEAQEASGRGLLPTAREGAVMGAALPVPEPQKT